jgi:CheY-like chemotaxis protein
MLVDFTADVDLSDRDGERRQMRVGLTEDRLAFATEDTKLSVATSDVFDIAQDISPRASGEATETVALAYKVGEARAAASIRGEAATLFQFQQTLFGVLLDGTSTIVSHTVAGEQKLSPTQLTLSVTSPTIQLGSADEESTLVIPRDEVTDFQTGTGAIGGDQQPVVTLYWVEDGRALKTAIGLPTSRRFNLFGRYIQSAVRLEPDEAVEREGPIEVLLVDDNPHDLEMGEVFLKRQSDRLSVTTATSAAAGLKRLAEGENVDCVVSDYDMPGTNGIEFLQQVRQQFPTLPFILFTGQGSEAIAKRAIIDDVTDYAEKGVGTDQYAVLAERILKAVG